MSLRASRCGVLALCCADRSLSKLREIQWHSRGDTASAAATGRSGGQLSRDEGDGDIEQGYVDSAQRCRGE